MSLIIFSGSSLRGLSLERMVRSPQPAGDFPHNGSLGPVLFAAAAKQRDDPGLGIQLARRSNQILQCIVGVRIIDDHQEGLPEIDSLETPRNALEIPDAVFNRIIRKS